MNYRTNKVLIVRDLENVPKGSPLGIVSFYLIYVVNKRSFHLIFLALGIWKI